MQALQDFELRYHRLFEASEAGVLILDAETEKFEKINFELYLPLAQEVSR